jgi:hypothetical protein
MICAWICIIELPSALGFKRLVGVLHRRCYGQLAVMSDVDGGGVCPECRQRMEGLPCYNKASTTERCWDQGGRDAHKVDECTE